MPHVADQPGNQLLKDQFVTRFVLMGFMGAGKTTVGRLLANRMAWSFLDVDHWIEAQQSSTIAQIFERRGEAGFRHLEAEAIRELSTRSQTVLALGGGAMEHPGSRELLASSHGTCLVFLDAPLDVMLERCRQQPDAAVRPLLQQRVLLEARLDQRLPHYRNAHLTIATARLTPDQVVERILEAVGGPGTTAESKTLPAAGTEGTNP